MGSIISHLTDIINEYGSYENYLKATAMEDQKVKLAIDQRVEIDLGNRQGLVITRDSSGIKFIAFIGSSNLMIELESSNSFSIQLKKTKS